MNIDYKAIGNRIRKARQKMGITQKSLAEKVDLSESYISEIETGKTMLSLPTIVNIANILKTSVDYFLSESIIESKVIYHKEAKELLDDLNHEQFKIMIDIMKINKEAIIKLSSVNKNKK